MPKLEQCIVLPGAGSQCLCPCNVCKLPRGCSTPQVFGEGHALPGHLWGGWPRLCHAQPWPLAVPGRVAPAGCWRSVARAHPAAILAHWLLLFAFDCAVPPACTTKTSFLSTAPFSCSFHPPPLPSSPSPALFLLLPFPPLLLNLYFFFSVPAKRYQSR